MDEQTKRTLLNGFIRVKRNARKAFSLKKIFPHDSQGRALIDDVLEKCGQFIVDNGQWLTLENCTPHELGAALGIHHKWVLEAATDWGEEVNLRSLVFPSALYRHCRGLFEPDPLWEAAFTYWKRYLKRNPQLEKKFFQTITYELNLPRYLSGTDENGRTVLVKKILPPLKVIDPDGSTRFFERPAVDLTRDEGPQP
jgi:hypothetical protein